MATTTNFGWTTPNDTDLVKDGASAIRTLGSGIDTSFIDLKGGTTGQVLSKATNTDLDYTWVSPGAATFSGCVVYNSAYINASNATNTLATWDSESLDTNAYHSTSTNPGRVTIPSGKAGKYLIVPNIRWDANSSGRRIVKIYKNASQIWEFESGSTGSGEPSVTGSAIADLAVGDYIEIYVYQTSGTTVAIANADLRYSSLAVSLIGA